MHDTVAFSENQDLAAAEGNVAAVADPHIFVNGDDIVIGPNNMLIGAIALPGSTGTRARLVSPSLRQRNTYDIRPLVLGILPGSLGGFRIHPQAPIELTPNEALNCKFTADPAAAEQESCVVFLAPGAVNPVSGKIFPVRFSVTLALVKGAWANAIIDLVDDLPTGTYTVVGAALEAAAGVAFRFYPVGSANRPGAMCQNTAADVQMREFRFGGLGAWFDFNTVQLPSVDILADAAAASATYYGTMDVMVKSGS